MLLVLCVPHHGTSDVTWVLSGVQLGRDSTGVWKPQRHSHLLAGAPLAKAGIHLPIPGHKQEGLPPGLDERCLLHLQNRCWDRGIIFSCNGSRFNVCLTHLSSLKVQRPSLFIWMEGTVFFMVRSIKYIGTFERASLECTESSCSAQNNC